MNGRVLHASAVVIEGRALLIEGRPGSGKSSLALALIDRGAGLIGDDAVTVVAQSGRLIAAPPPNIAGLLELRGVGLVSLPVAVPAPVALILTLGGPPPERLPETPLPTRDIEGIAVPVLAFDPGAHAPALRAEWALRLHGQVFDPSSLCPGPSPHRAA
ncbi:HPr kinase/phosphorylase [Erythrobacter sp. BLCC-B19]|uniref:HPr kinase/phosphorylase n=1 Tax=Erythrobacter sp. BLCC-B19 TaxID=3025315 RepID=UPI00235FEF2E|nr:HPr kinase/phosphatase C-terminal domain-containing protein [Erythrobacter sp. BLCC-B19]WDA40027.1 HPr kinase/phosphatase C-terminal domain-containing protein [Erythrobacter sp. BLCC-B19]